jgi:hypothetical protein
MLIATKPKQKVTTMLLLLPFTLKKKKFVAAKPK